MSGVLYEVTLDPAQFSRVTRLLSDLVAFDRFELMDHIAGAMETQTKNRLEFGKTSPEGVSWAPWSPAYTATRRGGQSLLYSGGDLDDSIAHDSTGEIARVGTNLIYGATHQFGRGGIPARPYLGLSDEDRNEITQLVTDRLQEILQ